MKQSKRLVVGGIMIGMVAIITIVVVFKPSHVFKKSLLPASAALAPTPTPATPAYTGPFGIYSSFLQGQNISTAMKVKTAQLVHVPYVRLVISLINQRQVDYTPYTQAGFKVLLTILNKDYTKSITGPSAPVTDFTTYATQLNQILAHYKPEVAVIENEEDNVTQYTGTPDQYVQELKTAIPIVHAAGLKVTNGGITDVPVFLLAWTNIWKTGSYATADRFAQSFAYSNAYHVAIVKMLPSQANPTAPLPADNPQLAAHYNTGLALVNAYKNLDLDYVNFHWYTNDPQGNFAFAMAIIYLRNATGKPVITNEFGQQDTSAATVNALLTTAVKQGLPYAIWFNSDSPDGQDKGLQDIDGTLRPGGQAFLDYMNKNYPLPDTTPPTITLSGGDMTLSVGSTFTDPGATATDSVDGSITPVVSGSVDTHTAGTYTLTYTATDKAGNRSTASRVVTVAPVVVSSGGGYSDTILPLIFFIGSDTISIPVGTPFVDPGVTATDNVDGDVTTRINSTNNVNTSTAGTYSVNYQVSDTAGNVARASRTIIVYQPASSGGSYSVSGTPTGITQTTDQPLDAPVSKIVVFQTDSKTPSPTKLPTSVTKSKTPHIYTSTPTLTPKKQVVAENLPNIVVPVIPITVAVDQPASTVVTSIEYTLDGKLLHTTTTFPDTWVLDTTDLANGGYTLTATYHYLDGSTQISSTVVFPHNTKTLFQSVSDVFGGIWQGIKEAL